MKVLNSKQRSAYGRLQPYPASSWRNWGASHAYPLPWGHPNALVPTVAAADAALLEGGWGRVEAQCGYQHPIISKPPDVHAVPRSAARSTSRSCYPRDVDSHETASPAVHGERIGRKGGGMRGNGGDLVSAQATQRSNLTHP